MGTKKITDLNGPQVEINNREYKIDVIEEPTTEDLGIYDYWLMGGKEGDKARKVNLLRMSEINRSKIGYFEYKHADAEVIAWIRGGRDNGYL
jgi:hypothetical protein